MNRTIYIMGVSGCGKTSIGKALSTHLHLPFFDGDDFHPKENIEKMTAGLPLDDQDREPWLVALNALAQNHSTGAIIACSALKQKYRNTLSKGIDARFVFLDGSFDTILARLRKREDHFMPAALLQSQFDILERPTSALDIKINQSIPKIIEEITFKLNMDKTEFGVIGLGVMGRNLARNIARNGYSLSLYNRRVDGLEENVAHKLTQDFKELQAAQAFEDVAEFVQSLAAPKKILIMVKAGEVVDQVIQQLVEFLEPGDIIIDGGNSHYKDTQRRYDTLNQKGIHFVGMGVSGGEEGALNGPAMMPGCSKESYSQVSDILHSIAAKNKFGVHCCQHIGKGGSGHFVKMIHNGIEYAEMQLLAECYDLMKNVLKYDNDIIASTFLTWQNDTKMSSYLLEISAAIFTHKENGLYIIDQILDQASNKGTGAWASIVGIELGIPYNIISSALYARFTSSFKLKRTQINQAYSKPTKSIQLDIDQLKSAYHLSRMLNHIQGFEYMSTASEKYKWDLNLAAIAEVWTGGCIIRSSLMHQIFNELSEGKDLMTSMSTTEDIQSLLPSLKEICIAGIESEIPTPTFSACLNYISAMKQGQSSANLIQAQRDYFGAHTYKLANDTNGPSHHTNWKTS